MLYKQIVLEWGQDTESGIWGRGYSPDNGKTFYVTDTTYGRKYRASDVDRLSPLIERKPFDALRLRSPNGTVYAVTVDDNGNLITRKDG